MCAGSVEVQVQRYVEVRVESRVNQVGKVEDAIVCGVPCTIYGAGNNVVCVRHSDGVVISLTQREAQLLSQMSTTKKVGEWLQYFCQNTIQERLKDGGHPILGRLLKWTSSFTQEAGERETKKQYDFVPL